MDTGNAVMEMSSFLALSAVWKRKRSWMLAGCVGGVKAEHARTTPSQKTYRCTDTSFSATGETPLVIGRFSLATQYVGLGTQHDSSCPLVCLAHRPAPTTTPSLTHFPSSNSLPLAVSSSSHFLVLPPKDSPDIPTCNKTPQANERRGCMTDNRDCNHRFGPFPGPLRRTTAQFQTKTALHCRKKQRKCVPLPLIRRTPRASSRTATTMPPRRPLGTSPSCVRESKENFVAEASR